MPRPTLSYLKDSNIKVCHDYEKGLLVNENHKLSPGLPDPNPLPGALNVFYWLLRHLLKS
jgi:hypothetical protein